MPRYRCRISRMIVTDYDVEVDAEDTDEAEELAFNIIEKEYLDRKPVFRDVDLAIDGSPSLISEGAKS